MSEKMEDGEWRMAMHRVVRSVLRRRFSIQVSLVIFFLSFFVPSCLRGSNDSPSRMTAPTTTPATQPTSQPVLQNLADGTVLADLVGRLVTSSDGRHVSLVFQYYGKPTQVQLLPNLELMRLENAVAEDGPDEQFKVSGRLTAYNSVNYLLVEKADRVEPPPPPPATTTAATSPTTAPATAPSDNPPTTQP
jgi:hypothetical protein